MNRDILKLIFFIVTLCLMVMSFLFRCKIAPYEDVYFISCPEHMERYKLNGLNLLRNKYPDSECNGVFVFSLTNGYMYTSNEPFAFNFVFCHYEPNIRIKINSITMRDEKNNYFLIELDFPINIQTNYFSDYLTKGEISDFLEGNIYTDYVYNIKKSKMIYIEMDIEVDNGENVDKKILKQILKRKVKRHIFKYSGV